MTKQQQSIDELRAAVTKAQEALAATEAARADLLVSTEPTSDLQAELQRAQDVQLKLAAYDRVIIAQRRELEQAEAVLLGAIGPKLRADLAQLEASITPKLEEAKRLMWQAYELLKAVNVEQVNEQIVSIKRQLHEPGCMFPAPIVYQVGAAQSAVSKALQNMGAAVAYAGPGGSGIMPAPTEAERKAAKDAQAELTRAQLAQLARKRELEGMSNSSRFWGQ